MLTAEEQTKRRYLERCGHTAYYYDFTVDIEHAHIHVQVVLCGDGVNDVAESFTFCFNSSGVCHIDEVVSFENF